MVFGGREDEDNVGRRFFKRLQESVKRLLRKHVRFIDNVDFEGARGGDELCVLTQLADGINPSVGGGVQLNDIKRSALRNLCA